MHKLIFGCGYLGRRVAERWLAGGHRVTAVTRSAHRAEALAAAGIESIVADVARSETLARLPAVDSVLFAVGVDRASGNSSRDVHVVGLKNVLDALPSSTRRIIYISSTSVYSQTSGELVDELSPCEPQTEGGRACLEGERLLAAHALARRACVLRLAGIYGPGRVPNREAVSQQQPIRAAPDAYLNLIHVDDAVSAVIAADELAADQLAAAAGARIFLVSDGHPDVRRNYYEFLAELFKAPRPLFEPAADSASSEGSARGDITAARGASNKRVSNARMLAELKVTLKYPTYRQGLAKIVSGQ